MKIYQVLWPVLLLASTNALAVRCGNNIVREGDLKIDVLEDCGKPLIQEQLGYVDEVRHRDRITVLKLEEWIYKINGRNYSFVFEGNRLKKIREGNQR